MKAMGGLPNLNWVGIMRAHGSGDMNHNSKKLIIHFCKMNSLIITGTIGTMPRGLSPVADITIALTICSCTSTSGSLVWYQGYAVCISHLWSSSFVNHHEAHAKEDEAAIPSIQ